MVAAGPKDPGPATRHDGQRRWQGRGCVCHLVGQCDELGSWYENGNFAAVYPVRGAPGISPAQLAMVTVLQFCENLTDRQAADEARGRVDWKYCLSLELSSRR